VRIATYNVEWFNALFDDGGRLLNDKAWSGRQNVTRAEQITGLAAVFRALDADAAMIIEAPDRNGRRDTVRALESFARHARIRAKKAIMGFKNDSEQEIALLYDPEALAIRHDPIATKTAPRFDASFRLDLDRNGIAETVTFSKPPLELACEAPSGRRFRMIGVHVKSKAPHGARGEEEIRRLALANRTKQLAQSIWLRHRIEGHLMAQDSLIVLGDFNDGPGLDEYEKLFGRSSVEIVMGTDGAPRKLRLFDPHARHAMRRPAEAHPATARFFQPDTGQWLSALLDYAMLSPDLCALSPRWRIWHPFDDRECYRDEKLRQALLHASDHFPLSVDLAL
jgi:endonuclease/exonuclease/phosphatase family metal-dependent hydrolase